MSASPVLRSPTDESGDEQARLLGVRFLHVLFEFLCALLCFRAAASYSSRTTEVSGYASEVFARKHVRV